MSTPSSTLPPLLRLALGTLSLVLPLAFLGACGPLPTAEQSVQGGTQYTQFSMRFQRGVYRTTNYRTDHDSLLLPVNTEVELLGTRGKLIRFRILGGQKLEVEHVAKHTRDTLAEASAAIFGPEPVDLSVFPEDQQEAIRKGLPMRGMTKEAVLAALGPPPAVGTLSLDSNVWKYWSTRWTTFEVRFGDDGRVASIGR